MYYAILHYKTKLPIAETVATSKGRSWSYFQTVGKFPIKHSEKIGCLTGKEFEEIAKALGYRCVEVKITESYDCTLKKRKDDALLCT